MEYWRLRIRRRSQWWFVLTKLDKSWLMRVYNLITSSTTKCLSNSFPSLQLFAVVAQAQDSRFLYKFICFSIWLFVEGNFKCQKDYVIALLQILPTILDRLAPTTVIYPLFRIFLCKIEIAEKIKVTKLFGINIVLLLFTAMTSYCVIFLLRFSCLSHHLDRDSK